MHGANDSELGEAEMEMPTATEGTSLTLIAVENGDQVRLGAETVPSGDVS